MTVAFDDVSFFYPGTRTGVEDVNFGIEEGELIALIGPSGSGKSTLLMLLAGFLAPNNGRIMIDGADATRKPPEKRDLGLVFQSYALFGHMRVWENVAYPLKVRGISKTARRRRAEQMLERVGLSGMSERHPASLSGGQRQRVALARALVHAPRALLLDEPLSALDAGLRIEMRDEIKRVQRDAGITTVHVTHDQEEALSIADRIVVLRDGQVQQIDTPVALYDNPNNAFVAGFLGHANLWQGTVQPSSVTTPIGILRCNPGDFVPGTTVSVLIRPERVLVHHEAAPHVPNYMRGRIVADRFLGAQRRVDFAVDGGVVCVETAKRENIAAISIPPEWIRLIRESHHGS